MGKIVDLKCNNCSYAKSTRMGFGLKPTAWEYAVGFCAVCGEFTETKMPFVLSGNANEGFDSTSIKVCEKGHALEKIYTLSDIENGIELICPICGNVVETVEKGFWD